MIIQTRLKMHKPSVKWLAKSAYSTGSFYIDRWLYNPLNLYGDSHFDTIGSHKYTEPKFNNYINIITYMDEVKVYNAPNE